MSEQNIPESIEELSEIESKRLTTAFGAAAFVVGLCIALAVWFGMTRSERLSDAEKKNLSDASWKGIKHRLRSIAEPPVNCHAIAWLARGTALATLNERRTVEKSGLFTLDIWAPRVGNKSWEIVKSIELAGIYATGLAIDPTGAELIVIGTNKNKASVVGRWSTVNWDELTPVQMSDVPGTVRAVGYASNGVLATVTDEALVLWERKGPFWHRRSSLKLNKKLSMRDRFPMAFDVYGNIMFVQTVDGRPRLIRQINSSTGLESAIPIISGGDIFDLVWAGSELLVATSGGLEIYGLGEIIPVATVKPAASQPSIYALAKTQTNAEVAMSPQFGVKIMDIVSRKTTREAMLSFAVLRLAYSPDGRWLAGIVKRVDRQTPTVRVWDVAQGDALVDSDFYGLE